jgi:hypothetical protein
MATQVAHQDQRHPPAGTVSRGTGEDSITQLAADPGGLVASWRPPAAFDPPPHGGAPPHADLRAAGAPSDIVIDAEIVALIPPPSPDERSALERQLLAEGCRDALTVWAERRVLLDGHTRLGLCRRHGLPYDLAEVSLPSRDAAIAWVLARQGGRRNLTPEGRSYLHGQRYLRERRAPGGTGANQHTREQTGQNGPPARGALARLAEELGVAPRTLKRDARFAADADALAAACGAEVKGWALARDARLTRRDVRELAKLPPAEQRRAIERVRGGGRLSWGGEDGGPERMTVPVETAPLVQALLKRLGWQRVAELAEALAKAVGAADESATPATPGSDGRTRDGAVPLAPGLE